MTQAFPCLRVRIADHWFDIPLASVTRVGRLDKPSWSGSDAGGGPLSLAQTDAGPVVVLSASHFLRTAVTSPEPAWAIVVAGHRQPVLSFAVCQMAGLVQSRTPAELLHAVALSLDPIPS